MRAILVLILIVVSTEAYADPSKAKPLAPHVVLKPFPFANFLRQSDSVYVYIDWRGPYDYEKWHANPTTRTPRPATEQHKAQLVSLLTDRSSYAGENMKIVEEPDRDGLGMEFRKGSESLTMECGLMELHVYYRDDYRQPIRYEKLVYHGYLTQRATTQLWKLWREYSKIEAPPPHPIAILRATKAQQ